MPQRYALHQPKCSFQLSPAGHTRGCKSSERAPEPRFLPFGRDAEVDVVLEPLVSVHVPRLEVCLRVLRCLDRPRVDVCDTVPARLLGGRVDAVVAQARQDARALGQRPYAVVFCAGDEAEGVKEPDSFFPSAGVRAATPKEKNSPSEEAIMHSLITQHKLGSVQRAQLQERQYPQQALDSFPRSRSVALGDLPLPFCATTFGIRDYHIEHAAIDPSLVFPEVEGRPRKQARKVEDIRRIVQYSR
jgi:hypothetical protein